MRCAFLAAWLSAAWLACAGPFDAEFARIRAVADATCAVTEVSLRQKSDPKGKDPLEAWRAEAKEDVSATDAFVRVEFTLVPERGSDIKCRAVLPLPGRWDGRFWGQGNSGRAGSLPDLDAYVAMGTAAATTDLGTTVASKKYLDKSLPWSEASLRDFNWRATHLMTVYGKRIVEAFYGASARHAYFNGGSTGGRQGMSEAIRFPGDYDGIIAALPDNSAAVSEIALWHLWRQTHDDDGRAVFTKEDFAALAAAAIEFRAKTDPKPYAGHVIADGRFTEEEIDGFIALAGAKRPALAEGDRPARLKALYVPLIHDGRCYFTGFAPGTDHGANYNWGSLLSMPHFLAGKGFPQSRWKDVGFEQVDMYLREAAPELNACSTDLAAFAARGGKIIMTAGWEDQTIPPGPIVDYYERVCRDNGGLADVSRFMRLFCIPGCAHGGGRGRIMTGSPSGRQVKDLLVAWCEEGVAPERLDVKWRVGGIDMPVAPYPWLYRQDDGGRWVREERRRCEPTIHPSCLATKKNPASGAHVVQTGSIAEGGFGAATAETLTRDGCGTLLNLFHGKWTAEKVRAVGEHCRRHGCTFTMDEMFNRWSGDWKKEYAPQKDAILAVLGEYADVCAGTQHYSESGGLMFYWHPKNAMCHGAPSPRIPRGGSSLAQAYAATCGQARADLEQAKAAGLPPPYFSIECAFGFSPYLLRAGYDRVDLEVVYSDELERAYAGVKTASEAFGRKSFGADMAMDWYGGMQSDGLWEARWRTSLYHAWLRGADPIYNEHGLMGLASHGRDFGHDDPVAVRYRKTLADFTAWCRAHPRADGYPLAAVGAIQGRFDGYVGIFQTHLFGQRTNDAFRVTEADRTAWRLFDGLYRRRGWQERDSWGDADFSGNPPLGAAGILPFDAPAGEFAKYRLLFFLGRNVMDDALYRKLVDYVKGGGTLMLASSHLAAQDDPAGAFVPYNGGDWSELAGVRIDAAKKWHLPHGLKFVKNPGPGWRFQPLTNVWDPDFIEGGFDLPCLEATTAVPFAVASDNFVEKHLDECKGVGFVNELGKGRVVFLASLDSPGAFGVRKLYSFLMAKALEAVGADVWPKVECADTVRWSVYPDGTVYLLNTEAHLSQEAVLRRSPAGARKTVRLAPGELGIMPQ